VLREYSKVAGMMKVESLADIREIRKQTADRVGISVDELVAQVSPLEALYTVCDHSRALIFLLGDGVVPSNSREGYFARLLVRRGLRALKDLNITYSLGDTVSFMIDQIREDYPEFFFNKGDILKLLKVEDSRLRGPPAAFLPGESPGGRRRGRRPGPDVLLSGRRRSGSRPRDDRRIRSLRCPTHRTDRPALRAGGCEPPSGKASGLRHRR